MKYGRRSSILVVVLLCSVLQHTICKSFFAQCDMNSDTQLSQHEFEQCFLDLGKAGDGFGRAESVVKSDLKTLFGVLDRNKDGVVSSSEYAALQQMMQQHRGLSRPPLERQEGIRNINVDGEEEEVEIDEEEEKGKIKLKKRDGTAEVVDKEEFYSKMNDQMKGFRRTSSDQLLREVESKQNLSHVMENEPVLRKVILLGEWSLNFLYNHRLLSVSEEEMLNFANQASDQATADGKEKEKRKLPVSMEGLSTIPINTETGERVSDSALSADSVDYQKLAIDLSNRKGFQVGLAMKVRLPSGQSEDYEVRIEYNRSKYPLKPHIAMTEATRLIRNHENNQVERVSLTLPEIPKVSFFQVESVTEDVPEPRSKSSDATNNGEDAKQDSTSSSHANSLKKKKVHYYLSIAGGRFKVPLQAVGYVATMMIFFFTGLGFMLFRKPKSKSD